MLTKFRVVSALPGSEGLIVLLAIFGQAALQRAAAERVWEVIGRWSEPIVASLLAWATLIAGMILLVSGATPIVHARRVTLAQTVPLHVIEVSHFVGSVVGALLLVLARGLQRRLDSAWWMSMSLMGFKREEMIEYPGLEVRFSGYAGHAVEIGREIAEQRAAGAGQRFLFDFAKEAGVMVLLKAHGGMCALAEDLLYAWNRLKHPSFGLCYDPGNIYYYTGEKAEEDLPKVAAHVSAMCIKDETGGKHGDSAHASLAPRSRKWFEQHERHSGDNHDQLRHEQNQIVFHHYLVCPADGITVLRCSTR